MKKKFLSVFMAVLTALCMTFALAACGGMGNTGTTGNHGSQEQQQPNEGGQGNDQGEQGGMQKPDDGTQESETYTEGLCFTEMYGEDGTTVIGYSVGAGEATEEEEIVIPSKYNNLPVLSISRSQDDEEFLNKLRESINKGDAALIQKYTFMGCIVMKKITIPNSVTSIGEEAFWDCDKLIEVRNHSQLKIEAQSSDFGYVAGHAKHVYNDNAPNKQKVTKDGYIFYEEGSECYLLGYTGAKTNLTLPACSPTGKNYTIYQCAFYNCDELTSVTIGSGVTEIGDRAFMYCSGLISVTIPDNVTSIESYAFYGCDGLEEFIVDESNVTYSSQDGVLYDKAQTQIMLVPMAIKSHVSIPDSVTEIGDSAFRECSGLTSVTIGSGVTEIGYGAFRGCSGLISVTIPDNVTSIELNAFSDCSGLKEVHFENPNGWKVSRLIFDDAETVSGLEDYATAAQYLTVTYDQYYWKREG